MFLTSPLFATNWGLLEALDYDENINSSSHLPSFSAHLPKSMTQKIMMIERTAPTKETNQFGKYYATARGK